MTTSIIHGDPGSFKTATLVSQYGVPALYKGRTVVTNIRGFNDLSLIEKVYKKKLPESAKIIFIPFTREGFGKMSTFFHWAPVGALILFDEIQRVYPTRLRDLKKYDCIPPRSTGYIDKHSGDTEDISTVEEAFDCHRHMNWDIYMSTPNIEKVHKELRQVSEFGFRQKGYATVSNILKVLLGDFKRVKHNAENKGTSDAQAIMSTSHRIDKRAFKCYESTATGVAKETDTKTSILAQPKLLLCFAFMAFALYRFADNYFTYGAFFPNNSQLAQVSDANTDIEHIVEKVTIANHLVSESNNLQNIDSTASDVSIWQFDKNVSSRLVNKIHGWTGTIDRSGFDSVYLFEIKDGNYFYSINSNELIELGFNIKPMRNFIVVYTDSFQKIVYPSKHDYQEEKQNTQTFPQQITKI